MPDGARGIASGTAGQAPGFDGGRAALRATGDAPGFDEDGLALPATGKAVQASSDRSAIRADAEAGQAGLGEIDLRLTAAVGTAEADGRPQVSLTDLRAGRAGRVHSWELVTAVDGPGTRITVFLSGCPLRCLYCHNPDTWPMTQGQIMTADAVLRRIRRYRRVAAASGGGLTLSGGEPLAQAAFAGRLLSGAKALGMHTALDTSGYLGARADDALLDNVDLVLLDVKSGLRETYKRATGGRDLAPTIAFGDRLAARGTPVWLRYVLVPGLTDAPDNIDAVAALAAGWPNIERIEVLPFHQMGRDKWAELGLPYELATTSPPDKALLARARHQFATTGLPVF